MNSQHWEKVYKSGRQKSVWPWSDLVSLIHSYLNKYISRKKKLKVLELGPGYGANIPFFLSLGFKYYGVETSKTATNILRKKYPKIKNQIICGDFTEINKYREKFDLIVDRGSMTHNSTNDIKKGLTVLKKNLKKNGYYFGLDWFSINHHDYKNGVKKIDKNTVQKFKKGQFSFFKGIIYFVDKKKLLQLFKEWKFLYLKEKKIHNKLSKKNLIIATWSFVVKKK